MPDLPDYALVTHDEAEIYLDRMGGTLDVGEAEEFDDDFIDQLIVDYSVAVRTRCSREFMPKVPASDDDDPVARTFGYNGHGLLDVAPFDLRSVESITMFTDRDSSVQRVLTSSEFQLQPVGQTTESTYLWIMLPPITRNAAGIFWDPSGGLVAPPLAGARRNIAMPEFEVTVLGRWGCGFVPPDVALACKIAIDNAYHNPGFFAAGGEGVARVYSEFQPGWEGMSLPQAALDLLEPYCR